MGPAVHLTLARCITGRTDLTAEETVIDTIGGCSSAPHAERSIVDTRLPSRMIACAAAEGAPRGGAVVTSAVKAAINSRTVYERRAPDKPHTDRGIARRC